MVSYEHVVDNETADFTHTRAFQTTSTFIYDIDIDEIENDECNQEMVIQFGATLTIFFFSFVILFSLFGNILVLVILFKYENVRSITNTLILNLAVSDLLFTLGLPFWAFYHMHGWTLGEPSCKVINFIFFIGFYSSGFFLILMTIHRFIAVMNPLSSIVSTTGPSGILTTVIVWAVSMLAASPVFFFIKVIKDNEDRYFCGYGTSDATKLGILGQNVLFVLTALVFIFCYSQILCKLMRPTAQRRRNKTVKLIFLLMVVFFLGWGPYNVIIFLKGLTLGPPPTVTSTEMKQICDRDKAINYALYITRLLAYSHCCLNPVFYVFAGVKFKTHLKKLLQNWGHSSNGIPNRESRITITSLGSNE